MKKRNEKLQKELRKLAWEFIKFVFVIIVMIVLLKAVL